MFCLYCDWLVIGWVCITQTNKIHTFSYTVTLNSEFNDLIEVFASMITFEPQPVPFSMMIFNIIRKHFKDHPHDVTCKTDSTEYITKISFACLYAKFNTAKFKTENVWYCLIPQKISSCSMFYSNTSRYPDQKLDPAPNLYIQQDVRTDCSLLRGFLFALCVPASCSSVEVPAFR